jgi:hypothetical protein
VVLDTEIYITHAHVPHIVVYRKLGGGICKYCKKDDIRVIALSISLLTESGPLGQVLVIFGVVQSLF